MGILSWCSTQPPRQTQPGYPSVGMEENGEFCVTEGPVTRTGGPVGILNWLKALVAKLANKQKNNACVCMSLGICWRLDLSRVYCFYTRGCHRPIRAEIAG